MRHLKYLRYLARHKWFVLIACWKRGLYWQGLIHDWSKFLPDEWFPYANYFYNNPKSEVREDARRTLGYDPYPDVRDLEEAFNRAWLKHQHRNPHHWQYWVLREDRGCTIPLRMPHRFRLEMLADWEGAGRAITGLANSPDWYRKNKAIIQLHPDTRMLVEWDLGIFCETIADLRR